VSAIIGAILGARLWSWLLSLPFRRRYGFATAAQIGAVGALALGALIVFVTKALHLLAFQAVAVAIWLAYDLYRAPPEIRVVRRRTPRRRRTREAGELRCSECGVRLGPEISSRATGRCLDCRGADAG
jgi:hypothetical protein